MSLGEVELISVSIVKDPLPGYEIRKVTKTFHEAPWEGHTSDCHFDPEDGITGCDCGYVQKSNLPSD